MIYNKFDKSKRYYHVSIKENLKHISPKNSESFCKYNKYGVYESLDNIKKICFSDSVHGCVQALCLPGWGYNYQHSEKNRMSHVDDQRNPFDMTEYTFYLYELDFRFANLNNIVDTEVTNYKVFDEVLTGEVSYSFNDSNIKKFNSDHADGVPCTFISEITVNMLPRHMCMFKNKFITSAETFMENTHTLSSIFILDFEISSRTLGDDFINRDRNDFIKNNVRAFTELCKDNLKVHYEHICQEYKIILENIDNI